MKRPCTAFILFAAVSIFLPLVGCQNSSAPDSRQTRLIADENYRLKSQVQKLETSVAKLTKDLQECGTEKEKIKKESEDALSLTLTTVADEFKKELQTIKDENDNLKTQIQKLQDELKQLKETSGSQG